MLQPRYQAVITVIVLKQDDTIVTLETGRPVDVDVHKSLMELQRHHGIRITEARGVFRFYVSRTWDPEDIAREIERILRDNSLTNLLIEIYEGGESKSLATLLPVE